MGSLAVCKVLLCYALLYRFGAVRVTEPEEIKNSERSVGQREG